MIKNNEIFWRWSKIILTLIIVLGAVIFAYGKLNSRVETLEGQAEEAQKTKETVIRMEEGIKYIKEAVKRIEERLE